MYNALVSTPRPPQDGVAKCDETLILVMLPERHLQLKSLSLQFNKRFGRHPRAESFELQV